VTSIQRPPFSRLAIDWQISAHMGWGVYGLNIALQLCARGITPIPIWTPLWETLHPLQRAALVASDAAGRELGQQLTNLAEKQLTMDCPLVHAYGNRFSHPPLPFALKGTPDVGIMVFELPQFDAAAIEQGRQLDRIVTSSTWNLNILRGLGFENVTLMLQGIDPTLFFPAPRAGLLGDRFTIFSGGKLEYRKGQDLVIAAVREFQKRHREAILVFGWHNPWPESSEEITTAGLVDSPSRSPDGQLDFGPWLRKQGITNLINLGQLFNWQVSPILREMDVAIFPSRCEGATNFVAMECMACGVPTILSANTGHLDLIADDGCYPLTRQAAVKPTVEFPVVGGWGESSVDEIVETLERIYRDREKSCRRGLAGARRVHQLSWDNQVTELLKVIQ
jgi:glycosyltransferase involved in cell wall biosynthesis